MWRQMKSGENRLYRIVFNNNPSITPLEPRQRIIAILLGQPEDEGWDNVVVDAFQAMDRVRRAGRRSGSFHRRGHHTILASGVSFRGGQIGIKCWSSRIEFILIAFGMSHWQCPGNLVNSRKRQKSINHLLTNKSICVHNSRAVHAILDRIH
ncbi:hypothetical protein B0H11DRAFT_1230917 [Mycena galericulata]|nr:hypothetical protein B0H11DRAFT_1230917 [Mycena galericulata]